MTITNDRFKYSDIEHGDYVNMILNTIEEKLQKEVNSSIENCDIFNIARSISDSAMNIQDVDEHLKKISSSEHVNLKSYKERFNKLTSKHQQLLNSIGDKCKCNKI